MKAITILFPVFFMLLLGVTARKKNWITPEQKAGANAVIFKLLFPILVFNLMLTVSVERSSVYIVGYVLTVFLISMAVGKLFTGFTGKKYSHFSWLLMATTEGGNVALPLYLSIVGASSNTVIFDIAGSILCFVCLPVLVAKIASSGVSAKELLKNIFSNSFVLAVIFGLALNLTGAYDALQQSVWYELYTGTIDRATSPIVGMILFILGYDIRIDKDTIGPIIRLGVVRILFYAFVIAGFFVFFPAMMQDKTYLMAVLIYFMSPTGFGMLPVIAPVFKTDEDASFVSAFMSVYMVVTLAVYAAVVVFLA